MLSLEFLVVCSRRLGENFAASPAMEIYDEFISLLGCKFTFKICKIKKKIGYNSKFIDFLTNPKPPNPKPPND